MYEKTSLVTGATSGVGKETARELVRRGHRVGIVCRNRERGEAAVAELSRETPDASVEMFLADLSVMDDVRKVAAAIRERYDTVDVLVNNAGIHDMELHVTPDGFDRMVATNHLGPFLLTNLLLEPVKAARGRIVTVASEAHRLAGGRIDLERLAEPEDYDWLGSAFLVYARSKLYNILMTQELAVRLAGDGVAANCLCPGMVASGFFRETPLLSQIVDDAARTPLVNTPLLNTPAQGARLAVRLATDPAFGERTGRFLSTTPGAGLMPATRARHDRDLQHRLWRRSAELVGL